MSHQNRFIRWFEELDINDIPVVGGKNASVGEMIRAMRSHAINVPDGFAVTADAYWYLLESNNLITFIENQLQYWAAGRVSLAETGLVIRRAILDASFPDDLAQEILSAYHHLSGRYGIERADVAVRSSATAEDLPEASFAGQHESFLNIMGDKELLTACQKCFASLFTDRAITYRENNGFEHMKIGLSIGIQKMVRSDKAGAGVMFSLDPETGFPRVIIINAAWGLGENVVQGQVTPDEYLLFKPLLGQDHFQPIIEKHLGAKEKKMVYASGGTKATKNIETSATERNSFVLTDQEMLQLARWAVAIEDHYQKPMDMEWAKDGNSQVLYLVQARPETVQSRKVSGRLQAYSLSQGGKSLLSGIAVGDAVAVGKVRVIRNVQDMDQFEDNAILVTSMTDPDWLPIMRRAAGIITDHGGRTSHAAIISRELGLPAIVGTGQGTQILHTGQEVTISCAEGDTGYVYEGFLPFKRTDINLEDLPRPATPILLNIGDPAAAFRWWRLPTQGIGLARMEFIISNLIKIHPMALVNFNQLEDIDLKQQIEELTWGFPDKPTYFVERLAQGIAKIAASQYPYPVIVRTSDFKTNEYANLLGGDAFEPQEANPMLGFRGASRYYSDRYRSGFLLECEAIRTVRDVIGLTNVVVMIPFCRTIAEAQKVLAIMASAGLQRGCHGLEIYIMCEVPSNVILAREFAHYFDGFSIGSNDLTQLALGIDRESAALAYLFDERDEAVKRMIHTVIQIAHEEGRKVGICGQAPSDYPDFADFLIAAGIDSISLNPDSVIQVIRHLS